MAATLGGRVQSVRRFPILYGTAWSLFVAVIGTLAVSLWVQYSHISDVHLVALAYVIHCLAVLVGSVHAGRSTSDKGWFSGGVTGLVYAVLMIIIGVTLYNTFSIDKAGLFRVLLMVFIGAFGGIIGRNLHVTDYR